MEWWCQPEEDGSRRRELLKEPELNKWRQSCSRRHSFNMLARVAKMEETRRAELTGGRKKKKRKQREGVRRLALGCSGFSLLSCVLSLSLSLWIYRWQCCGELLTSLSPTPPNVAEKPATNSLDSNFIRPIKKQLTIKYDTS